MDHQEGAQGAQGESLGIIEQILVKMNKGRALDTRRREISYIGVFALGMIFAFCLV